MRYADPLVKWILHKVFVKRENCVIMITGKVQKGKSRIALELAWRLLPFYFGRENIVWHPEGMSNFYVKGVKRGDILLYEEIGTEAGGIPRRRWYDFNNMLLLDIFQTHGFEGVICELTLPSRKYLDSNAEKLVDVVINAKDVDREHGVNIFTAYWTEYDDESDTIYKHSFLDDDGVKVECFAWDSTVPNYINKEYKEAEKEFKRWIQTRVNENIRKKKITESEENEIYETILKDPKKYMIVSRNQLKVSHQLIELEHHIGYRVAKRLRLRLEKEILTNEAYTTLRDNLSSNLIIGVEKKSEKTENDT